MFRRAGGYTATSRAGTLVGAARLQPRPLQGSVFALRQLTYDQWRAIRAVFDTGIHAMKWTRATGHRLFRCERAKTEADIINESTAIFPSGQALAYKIAS